MANEPEKKPTTPPRPTDLFGDPIPNPGDIDEEPGQNQDAGLTMNHDEWADLEEVWAEIDKQPWENGKSKKSNKTP
jgi:hypothetical protein